MHSTIKSSMGKITTSLVITNRADQAIASRGLMPAEEVRSIVLNDVLVDTGATTLCLPPKAIAE